MFKLSGGFQILWELENSLEMNNSLGTNSNWKLSGAKKKKKKNQTRRGRRPLRVWFFFFFFFAPGGFQFEFVSRGLFVSRGFSSSQVVWKAPGGSNINFHFHLKRNYFKFISIWKGIIWNSFPIGPNYTTYTLFHEQTMVSM